ncbi:MAG: hypothetical protein LKF71_06610 [Oscillospiraceae bacterium]|jgi:hypothetical protein|nr:hypothetical protein [Oscillospiraceae bacterium]
MVEDIKNGILDALGKAGESLSSRFLMRKLSVPEKYKDTFYTALNQLRSEKKVGVDSRHMVSLHTDDSVRIPAKIISMSR